MFRRLIVAGAIGAAAMYFLDAANGAQRRVNALHALDARIKQMNAALAGPGNRAVALKPTQALTTPGDQRNDDQFVVAAPVSSSRAKTTKRVAARAPKKSAPQE